MQLPDRRKLFQQRHHRREEIEAQLRRTQIDSTSSEDEESFEDVSDDEVVNEGESEEEVANEGESVEEVANEDESEEEVANEDESEEEVANEDESEEEMVNEDESEEEVVANEDESEEEMVNEDESEKEEEDVDVEEEYNTSFSEQSLANSSGGHNSSNNLSLNATKVKLDDNQLSVVHDESFNETLQNNTALAKSNNELMNKKNSDDDDKSQSLPDSNFNMNDRQNQVVEWMIARESQKPYGGIIATDMGTTDCKITILMHLLSKSKPPNLDNTQSEGETDLDETVVSSKGCTLILCPRSSIDHWFDRMNEKKNQGSLNVWLHYGRNRDISLQELTQKDVVITTVTLVLTGFRNKVNNPLYQIKWHRIILDDNKLYNYKQQTSKALCQLSGICHWVFSGPTIIDNDDDEAIYSLIKFINYTPLNIFENWKKWIKTNQAVSIYEKLGHLYYKKKIV
ncbi:ATP-dependent helicase rhp16 isoform X2 [Acyrthosiphon pisum]|uniref:SNF2 N-terminal domain-containing protein n=1 Tax=Acyrthosiphon pisum TaxID=7029 RepID=A0A8R2HBA2_ACYPI|nr:ATP-dependent helicase rhp16 isoform X2 [Acyrthosiphon pisum]|eukprot:XP_016664057.1 PREDICTED: ATP-dependent helicase rhp16 isoform X2 [Acyrthosiphon pisum]